MQSMDVFYNKGLLKKYAKFTGKHLCQSLIFNKVASLSLEDLISTIAPPLFQLTYTSCRIIQFTHAKTVFKATNYLQNSCFTLKLNESTNKETKTLIKN